MTHELIQILGSGLAIGFLVGIAVMLLFCERVEVTQTSRMAGWRVTGALEEEHAHPLSTRLSLLKRALYLFSSEQPTRPIDSAKKPPPRAVAVLTATGGKHDGYSWMLPQATSTTIGRFDDCDIALDDPTISRLHAQISHRINSVSGSEFALFDYSSSNNTHVNGRPISAVAMLRDGDQLQIGGMEFFFRQI